MKNHDGPDEGLFWMSWRDFSTYFDRVYVCFRTFAARYFSDESRRRRGRDVDIIFLRQIAGRRGRDVDIPRRVRGCDVETPVETGRASGTQGMRELRFEVDEAYGHCGAVVGGLQGIARYVCMCQGPYKMWCVRRGTEEELDEFRQKRAKSAKKKGYELPDASDRV